MTKELQDYAWSILPKEFKEEVNEIYLNAVEHHPCGYNHKTDLLKYLFGYHNLTSDVEGEEMLTVKRSDVINEFDKLHKLSYIAADLQLGLNAFRTLFGSKCLPDEDVHEDNFTSIDPEPAKPLSQNMSERTMTPTKDQQAQEYAEKKFPELLLTIEKEPWPKTRDILAKAYADGYTAAEQSMTDSETEHTKDEFVARMRGKFTEQDFTEAKQRAENCMASIPQFELPKQIEAQINKAMESIKAESRKQFGDFGAANADIAIPMYRQMMRLGALLALSAGYLESEQTDSDRGNYISMTKPNDPNKCTLFWREKGDNNE